MAVALVTGASTGIGEATAIRLSLAEGGYANVRRHMELNFDPAVRLTEVLPPLLRASAPSAIVNVASSAGRVSRARTGSYSASKFALIGWSDECGPGRRPKRLTTSTGGEETQGSGAG